MMTIITDDAERLVREGGVLNCPSERGWSTDSMLYVLANTHDLLSLEEPCRGRSCWHQNNHPAGLVRLGETPHHADDCGRHPGCWCMSTGQALRLHDAGCPAHDVDARDYCHPDAKPDMWHWVCEPIEQVGPTS